MTSTTRPILETFRELRRGEMLDEAAEGLAEVVKAVLRTGKGGTLTIKLNVKPMSGGAGQMFIINDDITMKLPLLPREPTVFFPMEDGNLSRRDPRQRELELRGVPAAGSSSTPTAPLRAGDHVNGDGEVVRAS